MVPMPTAPQQKERIRAACSCPDADIYFLMGGTQTNAVVISALLKRYEGVVAADTGHVSIHEAGAIEYTGHKVLTLPGKENWRLIHWRLIFVPFLPMPIMSIWSFQAWFIFLIRRNTGPCIPGLK